MKRRWPLEVIALGFAFLFLAPVLFAVLNSLKSNGELLRSFIALPETLRFSNYVKVWHDMNYVRTLLNTLMITFFGVTLTLLFSAMCSYKLTRMGGRWGFWLQMFFVSSMMVPFQTIMIPLVKVSSTLELMNSRLGLILIVIALFSPFTIFLYRGFIVQIPMEMEEASKIDGATTIQLFFRIILPLLSPITATAMILNTLWIWNDFILSFLLLQKPDVMTLQLAVYRYFGTYSQEWNLALASLVLSSIPVIIFYLVLQRFIIKGVTAGAVKG